MTWKYNPFTQTLDWTNPASTATGDVVGPASATDNAVVRFDSTTGKLIQDSSATISDTGQMAIGTTTVATRELNVLLTDAANTGGTGIFSTYSNTTNTALTSTAQAVQATITRTITASTTDTQNISALRANLTISPAAAQLYTNTNTTGVSGLYIPTPTFGAGTLAVSNLQGIHIGANTTNTGTNKYGIFVNDQSGSTNNYAIFTKIGVVAIGDTTTSSSTTTGALTVAGGVGIVGTTTLGDTLTGTAANFGGIVTVSSGTAIANSLAANSIGLQKDTSAGEAAITSYGSSGNHSITLWTSTGGAAATRKVKLVDNGNLLIGTTTDGGQKLQVQGSVAWNGSTSGQLTHQAAASTTSHTLTWPAAQGAANAALTNNGSGGLSWTVPTAVFTFKGFTATKASGTHTSNNAWETVGNWTEVTDTDGAFSPASGTYIIPTTGTYLISLMLGFAANNSGVRGTRLTVNGSPFAEGQFMQSCGSASFQTNTSALWTVRLTVGDTVVVDAFQNSGGNLNYLATGNSTFSAAFLGN